jgi:hypothetical protein
VPLDATDLPFSGGSCKTQIKNTIYFMTVFCQTQKKHYNSIGCFFLEGNMHQLSKLLHSRAIALFEQLNEQERADLYVDIPPAIEKQLFDILGSDVPKESSGIKSAASTSSHAMRLLGAERDPKTSVITWPTCPWQSISELLNTCEKSSRLFIKGYSFTPPNQDHYNSIFNQERLILILNQSLPQKKRETFEQQPPSALLSFFSKGIDPKKRKAFLAKKRRGQFKNIYPYITEVLTKTAEQIYAIDLFYKKLNSTDIKPTKDEETTESKSIEETIAETKTMIEDAKRNINALLTDATIKVDQLYPLLLAFEFYGRKMTQIHVQLQQESHQFQNLDQQLRVEMIIANKTAFVDNLKEKVKQKAFEQAAVSLSFFQPVTPDRIKQLCEKPTINDDIDLVFRLILNRPKTIHFDKEKAKLRLDLEKELFRIKIFDDFRAACAANQRIVNFNDLAKYAANYMKDIIISSFSEPKPLDIPKDLKDGLLFFSKKLFDPKFFSIKEWTKEKVGSFLSEAAIQDHPEEEVMRSFKRTFEEHKKKLPQLLDPKKQQEVENADRTLLALKIYICHISLKKSEKENISIGKALEVEAKLIAKTLFQDDVDQAAKLGRKLHSDLMEDIGIKSKVLFDPFFLPINEWIKEKVGYFFEEKAIIQHGEESIMLLFKKSFEEHKNMLPQLLDPKKQQEVENADRTLLALKVYICHISLKESEKDGISIERNLHATATHIAHTIFLDDAGQAGKLGEKLYSALMEDIGLKTTELFTEQSAHLGDSSHQFVSRHDDEKPHRDSKKPGR